MQLASVGGKIQSRVEDQTCYGRLAIAAAGTGKVFVTAMERVLSHTAVERTLLS